MYWLVSLFASQSHSLLVPIFVRAPLAEHEATASRPMHRKKPTFVKLSRPSNLPVGKQFLDRVDSEAHTQRQQQIRNPNTTTAVWPAGAACASSQISPGARCVASVDEQLQMPGPRLGLSFGALGPAESRLAHLAQPAAPAHGSCAITRC